MKITNEHLDLLKRLAFELDTQIGEAPVVRSDLKRPFGNSDYERDVAKILKWRLYNDELSEKQSERMRELFTELPSALSTLIDSFSIRN